VICAVLQSCLATLPTLQTAPAHVRAPYPHRCEVYTVICTLCRDLSWSTKPPGHLPCLITAAIMLYTFCTFTKNIIHVHSPYMVCTFAIHRVGQNQMYTPYITVYSVIFLPKIPYIHRICILYIYGSGQPYHTPYETLLMTHDVKP